MSQDIKPTDIDTMLEYKQFVSSEPNHFIRKLKLLAWMNKQLMKQNSDWVNKIILVGGTAVELYTGGSYASIDIDVLVHSSNTINRLLLPVGYQKEGRYWFNDNDDLVIECPDCPSYNQKYEIIDLGFGPICVLSIEDLIMDRVDQYSACHHEDDKTWAKVMLKLYMDKIDLDRIKQLAKETLATEELTEILKEIKE